MNRYKITKSLFLSLLVLFSIGCSDDWLDVNTDPNNPASATAELVFPAGVLSGGAVVGGYYNLIGGMWSQYWTQSNAANQYRSYDQYLVQSGDFNDQWLEMYAGCLNDLRYIIEESFSAGDSSFAYMATVAQVYFWQVMTDFHGDIPYTEALGGLKDNLSPKFDSQESIYDDLIKRLDDAMPADFTPLTAGQIKADYLFGGDLDKWVAFANTLKLKIYLRQMYIRPQVAQTGVEKLYADGATFLSEDAGLDIFENAENKDNPLYASNVRKLNVATNLKVSSTLFRYFEANSDPRLGYIVNSDFAGTVPQPQGGFNIPSTDLDPPTVAVYDVNATTPVYFISEVESYLLQAEAIARGWGTGDDEALYNAAVGAELTRKGFSADVATLVGDGLAYDYPQAGTFEAKQEAIMMAKWAAFSGTQGLEAFLERNRTGYPVASSVPSWDSNGHNTTTYVGGQFTYSLEGTTSGVFPTRMIYPQDEVQLNTNFPGQTAVTDPVWWDAK